MEKGELKEKSKILLVVPRYELSINKINYDYSFPMGLAYISAVLKKAGYPVNALNLNHFDGKAKDILNNFLNKSKYDFVLTGNDALGYNITKIIVETSREHPSKPKTILGGPIITSEPYLMFDDLGPDFGVNGEGEEAIVDLISAVESKKELKNVKGILFREGGKTIMTEKGKPPLNLDDLPFPDFEGLGGEKWIKEMHPNTNYGYNTYDYPRVYPLVASRSCPYHCTFCYHDNNLYRARSFDNIMKEIRLVVEKYGVNTLIIQDEMFALHKDRVYDFCGRIIALSKEVGIEIKWFAQMKVDRVDNDLLIKMREAGCVKIGYGFESFSQKVLDSMKKMIKKEQIRFAFFETLKLRMGVQANFIFGDIAETKETAYETLNWWKANARGQLYMDFIQPYPDSAIYRHTLKKGIIKDRLKFLTTLYERGNIVMNLTDNMTDEEIKELEKDVLSALTKYRKYVTPNFMRKTGSGIYEAKIECPHCKKNVLYKNLLIKDRFNYSFPFSCRECNMTFIVATSFKRIAYMNYDKLKILKRLEKKVKAIILKSKL